MKKLPSRLLREHCKTIDSCDDCPFNKIVYCDINKSDLTAEMEQAAVDIYNELYPDKMI